MDRLTHRKSDGGFFWGIPAFLWQIFFFYIPLTFLISTSFVKYCPELSTSVFTLDHYKSLCKMVYFVAIMRSLMLAAITVIVCLCIAYPVAYYLAIRVQRFKTILFALLILPFWTNFLLLVYAWYFLLENDGLINFFLLKLGIITAPLHLMNCQLAVYCGMFYCYLPFMLLPLYSTFERFDTRLLEASYDLGASGWKTFRKITLPLTMSGIRTGALLVFIPAFGEFVTPELLGGDKSLYVGTAITHFFFTLHNVSLGSAFTCLSTLILIAVLALGYWITSWFGYVKGGASDE